MTETVVIEGKDSFFLGAQAHILDTSVDKAWAERYVKFNPAIKWILGKFVEADNPNNNKQFLTLADVQVGQPTLEHAPMNMLHAPRNIVGSFVASDLVFPTDNAADDNIFNPYMEALGVFWQWYFPEAYKRIEDADSSGSLFFSMETVAKNMVCEGENGCGESFPYVGADSDTYCQHLQDHVSIRHLEIPHFLAGALIIPPVKPGWSRAETRTLSQLIKSHQEEAEAAYEMVSTSAPHLSVSEWEGLMAQFLLDAHSELVKV